jgi:site-specific recombinase XerD
LTNEDRRPGSVTAEKLRSHGESSERGLPQVVEDWLAAHTGSVRGDDHTARAYRTGIVPWLDHLAREGVSLEDARRRQADTYRAALAAKVSERTGRHLAGKTIARLMATASSLYQYMIKVDVVEVNPFTSVGRPTATGTPHQEVPATQIARIYQAAEALGDRTYVAVVLLAETGVRAGGLLSVDIEDLHFRDFDDETRRLVVTVRIKGGDTLTLPVAESTALAVERLKGEATTGPLFRGQRGRWTYRSLARDVEQVGRAAGVDHLTPHRLRTTWITTALRQGTPLEDVQAVAGHKHIETTQGYDRRRDVAERQAKAMDAVAAAYRQAAHA